MQHPINPPDAWRPVVGYEGVFEVSSLGQVRRVAPAKGTKRLGQPLTPQVEANGYLKLRLRNGDGGRGHYVHRLVAAAFLGPCPPGNEVHHRDHDRTNNTASNLEYVTRSENMRACADAGRTNAMRGEENPHSKLTEVAVREIRSLYPSVSGPKLAVRYGVNSKTIYLILKGEKWAHVKS